MDRLRPVLGTAGLLPLALLVGLAVTQGFDGAAFGVLAPEIRHTFHLDNAGIDAVTSLTAALPVMGAIFLGYFGDKGNRLHLTAAGAVLWGVAAIFTGLAPVLAVLITARLVGGVGLLASRTIYPSLLSDYYPPEGLAQIFTIFFIASTGLGLVGQPAGRLVGLGGRLAPDLRVLAVPTFVCAGLLVLPPASPRAGRSRPTARSRTSPGRLAVAGQFEGSIREGFRDVGGIRTLRRTWVGRISLRRRHRPPGHIGVRLLPRRVPRGFAGAATSPRSSGLFGLAGIVAGGAIARLLAHEPPDPLPPVSRPVRHRVRRLRPRHGRRSPA